MSGANEAGVLMMCLVCLYPDATVSGELMMVARIHTCNWTLHQLIVWWYCGCSLGGIVGV